jgi:Raf kinase inhibitor-like YbhB/YbcL family protein
MRKWVIFLLAVAVLVFAYVGVKYVLKGGIEEKEIVVNSVGFNMKITSSAFDNNQSISSKYTCNGENVSPPLEFLDVPEKTKSLVLIVDDPDAPVGTWAHWVVYNIGPNVGEVKENSVPAGGAEGVTSFGRAEYGGPCPPQGVHRYFFKLYALNKTLSFEGKVDKEAVMEAMKGAVIDKAELVGLYSQQK